MNTSSVKLIECPRDAMQGWKQAIPTEQKIRYLNSLLQVGFDTLDFGSFVSPKAIPQMADTPDVLRGLDLTNTSTKLLAIVANTRGAEEASRYEEIGFLGFPFSVSETFQQRNTNAGIAEALVRVEQIQATCKNNGKELVVYISMGFGNPYGDPYDEEIVLEWVNKLVALDIGIISLADTVGLATAPQVYEMVNYLVESFPGIETGVHLHAPPDDWKEKLEAACKAGCRRFDGALKGVGGCPMAGNELVGNLDTEKMIEYFSGLRLIPGIDRQALENSIELAGEIFQSQRLN